MGGGAFSRLYDDHPPLAHHFAAAAPVLRQHRRGMAAERVLAL